MPPWGVPGLDFPRRPPWSFAMSPEELRAREEAAFSTFLRALDPQDGGDVAPFEHNLEVRGDSGRGHGGAGEGRGRHRVSPKPPQTWRQLWRVLEMSDVVLLITDARHPVSRGAYRGSGV